jgi:hypothetical protein
MDKIALTIEDEVLDFVVEKALEFNLGARGLRSICEAILIDAMFELPSKNEREITITRNYAENKLSNSTLNTLTCGLGSIVLLQIKDLKRNSALRSFLFMPIPFLFSQLI